MSRLVLRMPAGSRPGAVPYLRLDAANAPGQVGEAQLALLPRAASCVGIWPAEQLTLLSLVLPAMPQARLQAALAGALEDRLLGDVARQHLAAAPRTDDGGVRCAACCDRELLAQSLAALEQSGQVIERVVPEPVLLEPGWGCLQRLDKTRVRLLWRDAQGEAAWLHLPADSSDVPCPAPLGLLVEPGLEPLARSWFGQTTELQSCDAAAWLARAAASSWDLRQFELAPRAAAQRLWVRLREHAADPAWQRAGWLAGLLLVVQLLGLNLYALQLHRQQDALQRQLQAAVLQALPGTPAVLDPGLQMARALDQARARAGAPRSDDLEVLMGEAAAVTAGAPIQALDFAPGRLELRLGPGQASAAMQRCSAEGLRCQVDGNLLRLQSTS